MEHLDMMGTVLSEAELSWSIAWKSLEISLSDMRLHHLYYKREIRTI